MNKKLIPVVLMATIMVAGISVFAPVDMATTVHTTISDIYGTPGGTSIATDIDDAADMVDDLVQIGTCEQVDGSTDPDSTCLTVSRNGILYVIMDVTIDGTTGLAIEIDGTPSCQDTGVQGAESPFLCVIPVDATDVITLIDQASDDSAGTASVVVVNDPVDPT